MPRRKGPSFTRADVIQAAIVCIVEKGPGVLGVNAVARQMGIKPPSLYNHVKGNQDLQRLVAIEGWRQLGNFVVGDLSMEEEPQTLLRTFAERMRSFAHHNKSLYTVIATTSLDPEDPDFVPIGNKNLGALHTILARLDVPEDDILHAMRYFRSTVEGFVQLELSGQFRLGVDPEDSFRWLLRGVLDAIQARARVSH